MRNTFTTSSISDRFSDVLNLIQMCGELIFKLVGREVEDIDVLDIKPWVMHAEVAEKFLSCNNRVILAGDAAHRFPPAGGFGKCQSSTDIWFSLLLAYNGLVL